MWTELTIKTENICSQKVGYNLNNLQHACNWSVDQQLIGQQYKHCIELPQDGILKSTDVNNDCIKVLHCLVEQLGYVIVFHSANTHCHQTVILHDTHTNRVYKPPTTLSCVYKPPTVLPCLLLQTTFIHAVFITLWYNTIQKQYDSVYLTCSK